MLNFIILASKQIPGPIWAGKVLLLGMVRAEETRTNKMGQEGRDRTRCNAMEFIGWDVYTADDKHPETQKRMERKWYQKSSKLVHVRTPLPKHCETNFAMPRYFFTDIRTRFGADIQFATIILDYFFSPSGYVESRWLEDFFEQILCGIVMENMLQTGCCVWLPHIPYTKKMIEKHRSKLADYYVVDYVADPNLNPLYLATGMEHVNMRLLQFPEKIINENQVIRLEHLSPFIRLSSKGKLLFEQEQLMLGATAA